MNASFTNVVGDDALVGKVVNCWASLFSPRVVTYRAARGFAGVPAMAVVVQRMVAAERSGVAFTADPTTGARDRVVVEAALGQGEVVVSGAVEPDTYVLAKDSLRLTYERVGHQRFMIVRGPDGADRSIYLDDAEKGRRVLTDAEVADVARLAVLAESHYGLKHGTRLRAGEVLVTPMTNPDWLPTIRRAAALVTDSGGMTCHAAIVARELGVPCVVGTHTATTDLADGMTVTVDGSAGEVREGWSPAGAAVSTSPVVPLATVPPSEVTGTRIYVNLSMPDTAEAVAAQDVDGVGLLRAEFMLTDALGGRHPRDLIARGEQAGFVAAMSKSLLRITNAFAPEPMATQSPVPRQIAERPMKTNVPAAWGRGPLCPAPTSA